MTYSVCHPGDLIMNKYQAHAGLFASATQRGLITPNYTVFRPALVASSAYFARLLASAPYQTAFLMESYGVGDGMSPLYTNVFYRVPAAFPPLREQVGIVRFLDHADRRFRRYVAVERKLIALLNEQKQAFIDNAVTRGVPPSSNLAELGSAPAVRVAAAWGTARLSALARIRSERNRPDLGLLSVFLGRGVIPYDQGGGQVHKPSLELSAYQVVNPGDLVLNNQQAWRGSVGVSDYHGIVSPAYVVLRLDPALDYRYARYLFSSRSLVAQYVTSSKGVGDIQRDIYIPWLKNVQLPVPPRDEQVAIADYLEHGLAALTRQTLKAERKLDLLAEYRTRLIADVVTGKLDVRDAASKLPDELEEPELLAHAEGLLEDDGPVDDADVDGNTEAVDV